jgi:uncharacterized protein YdeI (YjbR/CyaY-like superfamily)
MISSYLEDSLTSNKKALDNFNNMAERHKRNLVGWIDSAKKEETRKRRLRAFQKLLLCNLLVLYSLFVSHTIIENKPDDNIDDIIIYS